MSSKWPEMICFYFSFLLRENLVTLQKCLIIYLVLFEICSDSPSLVICKCMSVLLKKCVDTWNSTIPRVLQIFKGQTSEERTNKYYTAKIFLEFIFLNYNRKWQQVRPILFFFCYSEQQVQSCFYSNLLIFFPLITFSFSICLYMKTLSVTSQKERTLGREWKCKRYELTCSEH